MAMGLDSVVDYGNKLTAMEAAQAKESRPDRSFRETPPFAIEDPKPINNGTESFALTAGGIAALLAGACCVGPFVLVSAGLGGAWLANFQLFEPYRPVFIGIALAALGFAGWRVYRPATECSPSQACATPQIRRGLRIGFWIVAALLLTMLGFPYLAPFL
jgi:mercuric ion transport protein